MFFLSQILLIAGISLSSAQFMPLRQGNIHNAARLWVIDRATALARYGDISNWDTSNITSMNGLFDALDVFPQAQSFNDDISGWRVHNVMDMQNMFRYATSFNQDLGRWNVSKVERFDGMFQGAVSFNSDISGWNTSRALSTVQMFDTAVSFNHDLSNWNLERAMDFGRMFYNAAAFDQTLCWSPLRNDRSLDVLEMFCGGGGDFDPNCIPQSQDFIAESRVDCPSPTNAPTITAAPSFSPTDSPTMSPSHEPSLSPSASPTDSPTASPSQEPTLSPSDSPTIEPTKSPSIQPSSSPSVEPTDSPTQTPVPTLAPSKTADFFNNNESSGYTTRPMLSSTVTAMLVAGISILFTLL